MKPFVVAIDGPAGAGKSVTARAVAERLGLRHVDSGAMYRAVAWHAQERGVPLDSEGALVGLLKRVNLMAGPDGIRLDGAPVETWIRTAEAGEGASRIAVHPKVRTWLVRLQRSLAKPPGIVMEGRDIGTVVFPKADIKIYLTASPEARSRRRYEELRARGETPDLAAIEAAVRERDERDSGRATSPMVKARDAYPLDTSDLTLEEQVDVAVHWASLARLGPGRMTPIYRFGHDFAAAFSRTCLKFHLEGLEAIPRKGPLIVACNHISFWDPPLVGSNIPRLLLFMAKQELFQNRLFGALISSYNSIPVQRGAQARSALRGAEEALMRGWAVLIFPEGTRSKIGRMLPPKPGVARLAAVARAPVLPAHISGSDQIRRSMLRQVTVRIRFGSMIMPPLGASGGIEHSREYAERIMAEIAALSEGAGDAMARRES